MDLCFVLLAAGFDGILANRFPNLNPHNQFEGSTSFSQHGLMNNSQQSHVAGSENRAALALAPPQASTSGFQFIQPSQQASVNNPYDDWSQNPFSEEEIRVRSHELLESDDMQQLLRLFSMGGHNAMPDEAFTLPSFMPTPSNYTNNQDEDRTRPGRAVVGWLKIKAAMRWGFFIRKKAAERRALLVELDD